MVVGNTALSRVSTPSTCTLYGSDQSLRMFHEACKFFTEFLTDTLSEDNKFILNYRLLIASCDSTALITPDKKKDELLRLVGPLISHQNTHIFYILNPKI